MGKNPLSWEMRNPPGQSCDHGPEAICVTCNPLFWNPEPWMVKGYSEQSITAELVKAKNAYYKTGTSHLTDHEYDALEGSLRALCPEAEILQKVGTVEEE